MPLGCFAKRGADMRKLRCPLAITTSGTLDADHFGRAGAERDRAAGSVRSAVIRVGTCRLRACGIGISRAADPCLRPIGLEAVLTCRDVPENVGSLDALLDRTDLVVVASPNADAF